MSNVLSKLLLVGAVLVAACVGDVALPASAAPSEGTTAAADPDPDMWHAGGTFTPMREGIDLGPGEKIDANAPSTFKPFDLLVGEDDTPLGMHVGWYDGPKAQSAKAAYPIKQFGEATEYWLQIRIRKQVSWLAFGECEVFRGKPGTSGAEPVWTSPFQCDTSRHGLDNDFDFTVDINKGLSEASGTIRTQGSVSLVDGQFQNSGGSFFKKGDASLGESAQTRFDTVLRKGETSNGDHTYVGFQYKLLDHGAEVPFQLLGSTTSDGDQRCLVVPVGTYECVMDGHAVSGVHWDTTFTISKK